MSKKPYDWDREPALRDHMDRVSDITNAHWHAPINMLERSFWRGVVVGAIFEAVAFLLIFGIVWLL